MRKPRPKLVTEGGVNGLPVLEDMFQEKSIGRESSGYGDGTHSVISNPLMGVAHHIQPVQLDQATKSRLPPFLIIWAITDNVACEDIQCSLRSFPDALRTL